MVKSFLKLSLGIAMIGTLAYGFHEMSLISQRLEKIEKKLGGARRMSCDESDTLSMVRRSVVRVVGGESEGSGFAVQKGGILLTNFHVIESEPNPKVILPDNTFETSQVIMADKDADLAVLKIEKDLPVLSFASPGSIRSAESLFAIGFPMGGTLPGEASVLRGSFSRRAKDKKNGVDYVQTSITMIEGISGGPMVNSCGEVVGINTSGLLFGGMGIAISSESITQKWQSMAQSKDSAKDIRRIVFQPDKNALEAVKAFYNYLKARRLEKAFELLSQNFVKGYSFKHWAEGYRPLLDTTLVLIKQDKEIPNRINVKLATKDLKEDEILYKFFEGYWDVRQVNGKWLLWSPKIREIKEPDEDWFIDPEQEKEVRDFIESHPDFKKYWPAMDEIAHKPGNEELGIKQLYDLAKAGG